MSSDFTIIPEPKSGFQYFFYGLVLCIRPGLRRFVVLPLIANFILFGSMLVYLFLNIKSWIESSMTLLPSWLSWLDYILVPIAVIVILGGSGYFFGTVANLIAAPFNGLLAEKLEAQLTGEVLEEQSILYLLKDTPRILHREWKKLLYCVPKAFLVFLLFFIPLIGQTIAPIIWFLFTTWVLVIQYCDYPFDNHKVPFKDMTNQLKEDVRRNYTFGIMVNICAMIPVINWFVMPVAVCGATAMWVDCYKPSINDLEGNGLEEDNSPAFIPQHPTTKRPLYHTTNSHQIRRI